MTVEVIFKHSTIEKLGAYIVEKNNEEQLDSALMFLIVFDRPTVV